MHTLPTPDRTVAGVSRRGLLKAGLTAGAALSACLFANPSLLWGVETGQPRRGGILRVRGYDPPHFDHHLTINFKTNTTLSFAYSTPVRISPSTMVAALPRCGWRSRRLTDTQGGEIACGTTC
jgi:hypothetical protein